MLDPDVCVCVCIPCNVFSEEGWVRRVELDVECKLPVVTCRKTDREIIM